MRLISHWFIRYEPTEKKPCRNPPHVLMPLHPRCQRNLVCCGAVPLWAERTPPWGTQFLEHPCCSSVGWSLSGWRWGQNTPLSPRCTACVCEQMTDSCGAAKLLPFVLKDCPSRWWPLHHFDSSLLLESASDVICCLYLPSAVIIFMLSGVWHILYTVKQLACVTIWNQLCMQ